MQTEEIRKYQERLDAAPEDLSAYDALERLFTRAQDWSALVDLYRRKAPHLGELGEKRLLWQKIARVAEEVLDDPDVAIRAAHEVLPPEALDRSTLKAIEGLCRRHRRWHDLRDVLERAARHAEDKGEALAALQRLGDLYRTELGDLTRALECYDELLRRDPRNPEALRSTEDLLVEKAARHDAAAVLETAYRASTEWERLFALYARLLKDEADPGARVDLLRRHAALVEERRGPEAAFPELAKAFLETGRDERVRADLERIAERAGLWRDLLAVYLKSLDRTGGDPASLDILRRAAQIAEENLGLKAVAEKCYRRLLDFDPGHEEALGALERIYGESGDDAALLEILERRAARAEDPVDLKDLLRRAGEIAEQRLGRPATAIEKYEAILRLAPDDAGAKEALLRLYPRAERWRELVEHLLREAKPAEMVEVRRRVAEICEEKIDDVPAAIEHQEEVLRLVPGDPRALEALTGLYERAGRPGDLLRILEQRGAAAEDPGERRALRLRIAEVHLRGLGQPVRAADLYGELLEEARSEPAGEQARRALESMLRYPATRARAAALLERFYSETEQWARLVDLYERVLSHLPTPRERARTLQAVALAYERRLDSPERAFWAYGRSLKEDPSCPGSEDELWRLAGELSFHDELARLLEEAFEGLTGEKRSEAAEAPAAEEGAAETTQVIEDAEVLEASDLAAPELADAGAEELVTEIDENEVLEVVDFSEEVLVQPGPPVSLALPLVPPAPGGVPEPAVAIALRFALRLAGLNEEILGRREAAAAWYRKARALHPDNLEALEALDRLALERGDEEELREVLEARVARAREPGQNVQLRLRLGALLETAFHDRDRAIAEYRAALAAVPGSAPAFQALEGALRRAGMAAELADLYREALGRSASREVSLKLANLLCDSLGDAEGAVAVLRPLLDQGRDPEVAAAFERAALQAGYDRDERAEELIPVLQALRDLSTDPAAWRERERRIGEILETALGRPAEAVDRYARVLREDGEDARAREALERLSRDPKTRPVAARVLEPYYRERREWDRLVELLSLRLEDAATGEARAALYAEIARIEEEFRGDREAAFLAFAKAVHEEPANLGRLEAADRLATELGHFEELCALFDGAARALEKSGAEPVDRVHILRRLAEVSVHSLGDRERALDAYRRAMELQPENEDIFRALEQLYTHLERWTELADLFREALRRDPENRAYALRLADLLEVILESPEEALEVLRGMLSRNPRDPEALRAFEGVFVRAGLDRGPRAAELVPVLESLGQLAGDSIQRRVYEFRIGEIYEQSLGRPRDAVLRYGFVLQEDPEAREALRALERLSHIPECRSEACAILDAHYRRREEWAPLADVLERRLEELPSPADRARLLAELGQIQAEHLGNQEAAFRAYARAFAERPADAALLDAAFRWGMELGRAQELAELLEEGANALGRSGEGTPAHRVRVLTLLARLYAESLGEPALAISAYERALALAPDDEGIFVALEGLYTGEGRFADLATLYRKRLAREPADRATALKLARVLDEVLGEPRDALEVLRALLARAAGDGDAMRAFDRIFTRAGLDRGPDAEELLPILLKLRDASSGAEAREYEFRAGTLRELSLAQPAEAVPHYAAVLTADATHTGAREALERLIQKAEVRPAVAEVLEPFYRAQEDWGALVSLLQLRAGDARKPKRRAALLFEVGRLEEEFLHDHEAAFDAYARAFEASPDDPALLEAVERLSGDLGKFAELADLLAGAAAALEAREASSTYRVGVLQRLAATSATVLGDNDRAIEAYSKALDLDPENDATLTGLDRLYSAEGRARDLARVLEREIQRADAAPEVYDKADLLRRLARLREEVFGDLDGAAESFEELRSVAPDDAEAVGSLERLYEAASRWRDLAELLLETAREDRAGRQRLLRAAALLETRVSDLERARQIYEQLLGRDRDDLEALHGLERVLSRPELAGREAELLRVLEALESRAGSDRERAEITYRQGALLRGPLGRPEDAVERFTRVLELNPGHREALLALEELGQLPGVRDVAVPRLERHYERAGAWQALVDLYEAMLPLRPSEERRVLLRKMAEIYERELRNPRLAFGEYARLFREEPDNRGLLNILERLAQEMGSYERLANLYDELVREIPDRALGLDLTLRLARLYEETLGRKGLAVDRYQYALELDPNCREALESLDRIYGVTEEWVELQKVLKRKIELAESDRERVELHCRLGSIYESQLNLAGAAVESFESALALSPEDEVPLAALERIFAQREDLMLRRHIAETLRPIYESRDDKRRLAALELGLAEVLPASDREAHLIAAARLHEDLGEVERAFRVLLQGLREGCHSETVLGALERLAAALGAWEDLCRAADQAAETLPEDAPRREELTLRAAKWYWDRLSDPNSAEQRYTWVFLRDPAASPAFRALEAIHTAVFDPDKLLDLNRRRLAVVRDKEERAQLLKRIGDLNADFLSRPEEGIQAYEESLRLKPDDPQVLEALIPLYEQAGRFHDLCRVLERKIERAANDEEKFVLSRRLAEVWGAEIGDDAQAIQHYRTALTLVPTDLELWRAVRWHCTRAERWQELAEVLQREMELTSNPVERATVARELATIEEERLKRPDRAADALRELVRLEPGDRDAFRRYEALLQRTGRWADLLAAYEQRIAVEGSLEERVRLLAATADVAEQHMGDLARATTALEQLCELKPQDLAALRDLARIYEKQGRWKDCFEFFKNQVKRVGETGEVAVELLCRMGLLCEERAKNLEVAEKCYKRALGIEPHSRSALEGLRRVYEQRGEPALVAEVLKAEEKIVEGDARAALAVERAKILRDQLGDLDGAAEAFESALRASTGSVDAAQGFVELLDRGLPRERSRGVLGPLIEIFAKTRRIRDRHLALYKLGGISEALGDGATALAAFEAAYQASSTHLPTLLALGRLYYDGGHWEKALKMLQILLLNEGSLPTSGDRVELFFRLGSIRQKMGERARAINMYQRALEIDGRYAPARKALDELLGS